MVYGGDNHAAGIDAHHFSGWQVGNGEEGLAEQFFRLVRFVNPAQDDPVNACAVIEDEFQELFGLFDRLACFDLDGAEVRFGKGLEINEIREERFNFNFAEIDGFCRNSRSFTALCRLGHIRRVSES